MIFITGGIAQGKTEFARSFQLPIHNHVEQEIKQWLAHSDQFTLTPAVEEKINALLALEDCVVICAEVGYGIVPLDKAERVWREVTGRTACQLAKKATEVYKLEAGIPTRLK